MYRSSASQSNRNKGHSRELKRRDRAEPTGNESPTTNEITIKKEKLDECPRFFFLLEIASAHGFAGRSRSSALHDFSHSRLGECWQDVWLP
jgi:hypothetical protein